MTKKALNFIIAFCDLILMPLTLASSILFLAVRRLGVRKMVWSKKIFMKIGVFPIRDHYYEPLFNSKHLRYSLRQDRHLPGIKMNDKEQIELLRKFNFNDELVAIPMDDKNVSNKNKMEFFYNNPSFGPGDAEYLYNMIRLFKPKRIIEIGSGYSTLLASKAIRENQKHDKGYVCEQICVEPYEMDWLEKLSLQIIRNKIESVDKQIFNGLEENDILFIDSSHMIRPQGDVNFEYLELLPIIKSGVIVHIHDIFTPKDYLDEWILGDVKLWNEQYLLEAFLVFNTEYRIIGALNYLKHHYAKELYAKCPILANKIDEEPCSCWLIRS